MKILLVCGIYPPEIGGPARYAQKIAEQFINKGNGVSVLTYSTDDSDQSEHLLKWKIIRIVRRNKILNRMRFFAAVYRLAPKYDLVYMLDWFAAGFPAALAARLRGKKYVVRVGGDYLWEQRYLESGEPPIPLTDFCTRGIYRRARYTLFYRAIRFVLRNAAHVIFNSDRQRELYIRYYGISAVGASTIYNPIPRLEHRTVVRGKPTNEFIYWGRFIVMKNLTSLVRAFAAANLPGSFSLTFIGDGPRKKELADLVRNLGISERVKILPPMPLPELLERGKNCRAFILPSWTDISPNQVYECLSIGLPVLATKENYLNIKDLLPEMIDPNSISDISKKLEKLADDAYYSDFVRRFKDISIKHDWDDVVKEHKNIFMQVQKNI
ncbi:MAG TPA: glycosyltransferase family 4 protein [Candidatus Paceibacterota bacterium]